MPPTVLRFPHPATPDVTELSSPATVSAPTLPYASFIARHVACSTDRVSWLKARANGITATDVARLASRESLPSVVWNKRYGSRFGGNPFTEHGRAREPEIAAWVRQTHSIDPSTGLYHAENNPHHLATPDGIAIRHDGTVELAEIKTTSKPWRSIPRHYLRQVWWQQYVLGAKRTLVAWEVHENFVPIHPEPEFCWVDRDDTEISRLISLAEELLTLLAQT